MLRPEDSYRGYPTIHGDWDRFYKEFPERYHRFALSSVSAIEEMQRTFGFDHTRVLDVASGTGRSTFAIARYADYVVGVEPWIEMRSCAIRLQQALGITCQFTAYDGLSRSCRDRGVHCSGTRLSRRPSLVAPHPITPVGIAQIAVDGQLIRLTAQSLTARATCPDCHTPTSRVHERYIRRPLDLPWRGYTVRLTLSVRRFRCANRDCARGTFAEAVGAHLPKYARRTAAATATLLDLAYANGGEAGARLAGQIGLPTSPDTLLRLLRKQKDQSVATPRVLGVDDFALRRRHHYGTLLVDLETNEPIDVLDGRDAETFAQWLKEHVGVEVIVRDRAEAYAEGAAQGAPDAQQVADRFHLLQNGSAALDELLRGRRRSIEHAEEQATAGPDAPAPENPPSKRQQERTAQRARRVARWRQVCERHAAGQSISRIARELGMDRKTIRRYLATPEAPQRQLRNPRPPAASSPTLQPFMSYLQDRWEAGCTNISQLYRELVGQGYTGSRSLLNTALLPWRGPPKARGTRPTKRRFSVRWLCLRPPEQLDQLETQLLAQVLADDPILTEGYNLLQRFRRVLREHSVAALPTWLADAQASGLAPFVALANGIIADRSAVEAALTMDWSNGPTEGHVHRVKLLKRQGYGRCKLDLLRRRILAA